MRNSGIDASLEYHQPLGKDLHLTVRGNFTYARNRIMDQDEPDYAYTYMNHSGQMQWQKFGAPSLPIAPTPQAALQGRC